MALYKWTGSKNTQIEVSPPVRDRQTKQIIKSAVVLKFKPLENTSRDGKDITFDKNAGYLEITDPKLVKFIEQTPYYKKGKIRKVSFKKEAVFVECPVEEVEDETPTSAPPKPEKKTTRKPVTSVKDV